MPPKQPTAPPGKVTSKQEELLDAVRQGDEASTSAIIALGIRPSFASYSASPLLVAVEHGHQPLVRMLVSEGADPNQACGNGHFPLRAACMNGDLEAASLLLDLGADVNLLTNRGTALMAAAAQGDCDVISLLVSKAAHLHLEAKDGATALLCAVRENRPQAVHLLLKLGADPGYTNRDGVTALHLAEEKVLPQVCSLLMQFSVVNDAERALRDSERRQEEGRKQVAEDLVRAKEAAGKEMEAAREDTRKKVDELRCESEDILKQLGLSARPARTPLPQRPAAVP